MPGALGQHEIGLRTCDVELTLRFTVDHEKKELRVEEGGNARTLDLHSKEAFEIVSREWVRLGWNQKYQYTYSWLGRPVIQLPSDMLRLQEAIYQLKPDYIIETGVAHGGSLIFSASLCELAHKGHVIGIDIEIRPHNRKAIEAHELSKRISLVEGSSTAPEIIAKVKEIIAGGAKPETVLVILDSDHSKAHVARELDLYCDFVTPGSYIVATDGIMYDLHDMPRGKPEWVTDNPTEAARDFAKKDSRFMIEPPKWPFNESELTEDMTHWPDAWLKRVK